MTAYLIVLMIYKYITKGAGLLTISFLIFCKLHRRHAELLVLGQDVFIVLGCSIFISIQFIYMRLFYNVVSPPCHPYTDHVTITGTPYVPRTSRPLATSSSSPGHRTVGWRS